MKKQLLFKKMVLLCMLIASGVTARADYYKKVTSSSDLVAGATYIIASKGTNDTYVATSFSSNELTTTKTGFTASDDVIVSTSANFMEFTLGTNGVKDSLTKYTLRDNSVQTKTYLSYGDSSTDLAEVTSISGNKANWLYKYNVTYNVHAIRNCDTSRFLALSGYSGTCTIRAYSGFSKNPPAFLYKKVNAVDNITATVTAAGYATFVPPHNVEFAPGEAFVITAANEVVTMQGVTQVKAGTPVLLKGEGTKEAVVLDSEVAAPAQNLLHVSDGTITASDHVYVLSKQNGKVGFYLWTGDSLNAGKVYLTIPGSAREFIGFDDTTTTEIFQMEDTRGKKEDTVYDLQGRKMANGQLQRGLYIVNGKKVLIK